MEYSRPKMLQQLFWLPQRPHKLSPHLNLLRTAKLRSRHHGAELAVHEFARLLERRSIALTKHNALVPAQFIRHHHLWSPRCFRGFFLEKLVREGPVVDVDEGGAEDADGAYGAVGGFVGEPVEVFGCAVGGWEGGDVA